MSVEAKLPEKQFDTVVRWIKTCDAERVRSLKAILEAGMKDLRLKPDPKLAVSGSPPAGSDQFDSGSVRDWIARIGPRNGGAKRQVAALHATVMARGG